MKAARAEQLLRRLKDETMDELFVQNEALWGEVDAALANGIEDGTDIDLGALRDLQPLIEALRADAIALNEGRKVAVYAVASNQRTSECYFYGIDGADRDFCIRMTPIELQGLVMRMQTVLRAVQGV